MNEKTRRFSIDDKFIKNKKVNDILYGYLQSISHLDRNDRRFVYIDNKIQFATIERILDNGMKSKTLSRNFKFLLDIGFIEKGKTLDLYEKVVDVYFLPYDKTSLYQMINIETLNYLIKGTNANVIKVYTYLLSKYNWKEKENCKYVFTKKEILIKLGASTTNQRDYDKVNIIMDVLIKLNLIQIETFYCSNKNGNPTPKIRLLKVNEKVTISKY